MEVAPGIHHFNTDPFNWYVLEEEGRLTVVDAGFPGHYGTFLEGLASLGKGVQDVEAILITHAHADHTGFAERLRKATQAPVFVHREDRAAIGRVLQLPWWGLLSNGWRPFTASMLGRAIGNGVFRCPHITQAHTFEDGDLLDLPGRPRVLHIPGHTAGQVVFHLPERGVLLSSDTLVTQNLLTGKTGHPQVPARVLNHNDRQARHTIDRLRQLGTVTLLPGHGPAWTGTMEEAVELARR